MNKFTKGPWTVLEDYDNMMDEHKKCRHTIRSSDGWNVARVWELPESTANAEFIVKACNSHYDLLEACKKAESCIETSDDLTTEEIGWVLDDLRLAIVQATGD